MFFSFCHKNSASYTTPFPKNCTECTEHLDFLANSSKDTPAATAAKRREMEIQSETNDVSSYGETDTSPACRRRLFWDSPLPPFGFFLVCSHHPEQQQTRQPQPKEQYPLSHQPCRNCRFRAAGRNRTMVCTISPFGVKISRAVPYSSVVKSA